MIRRLLVLSAAVVATALAADEYSFDTIAGTSGSTVGLVEPARGLDGGSATMDSVQQAALGKYHIQHQIRAGEIPVRGVNLGSWLVAEKWMTQKADFWQNATRGYEDGGEYQVMAHAPNQRARRSQFHNHHSTFIRESDIAAIAKAGLNTVRVPVGYWIMGMDPFDVSGAQEWKQYPNCTLQYLDALIKHWALKHNVAVMISIHAAKGSQNGADHSAPTTLDTPYWSQFPENVNNTIYLAKFLAERYKYDAAFLGMGLLNEPNGKTDEAVVNKYYQDAYAAVRATGTDCILAVMPMLTKQDATNLNGFMEAPAYKNVWVEWHPYFIWGYEKVPADELVAKSILTDFQNKVKQWTSRPNANKLFFGEWCLANTGQFPNADTDAYRKWTEAQLTVMNQATGGWTYWSWRVYDDDHDGAFNAWSMRNVLAKPTLAKIVAGNSNSASQTQTQTQS